jgi:hypothetical protein
MHAIPEDSQPADTPGSLCAGNHDLNASGAGGAPVATWLARVVVHGSPTAKGVCAGDERRRSDAELRVEGVAQPIAE